MFARLSKTKLLVLLGLIAAAACATLYFYWDLREPASGPDARLEPLTIDQIEQRSDRLIHAAFDNRDSKKLDEAERFLRRRLPRVQQKDRVYAALAMIAIHRSDYRDEPMPSPDALALLRKALDHNPRSARALEWLSHYHEQRQEYGKALSASERWLAAAPHELRAMVAVGRSLLDLKHYARAEQALKKALERSRKQGDDTTLIKAQEYLGKVYMLQGKYKLAERVLLDSVKTFKQSKMKLAACPYASLGALYSTMGDDKKALVNLMKAADQESSRPRMQHQAAVACFKNNDFANAIKYIDRALALENTEHYRSFKDRVLRAKAGAGGGSQPAKSDFELALGSFEDHRFSAARRHVAKAMTAGAEGRHKVLLGFLLLLQKKYDEAGKRFGEADKDGGAGVGPAVGQGHLAIIRKDYVAARRLLAPGTKTGDKKPRVYRDDRDNKRLYQWVIFKMACLGLGWASANVNKHPLAITYFDRIIAGKDEDVFAWLGKGNSLNALNRLEAAEKALRKVLKMDPANKYATAELALVQFNRGKDKEAERLFKAALKQDEGQYTCPHEGLGLIYLRAGKLARAKASFRKAIKINPDIEFKKFNGLARILIREGQYEKARKLLRKSMENNPYEDEARKMLAGIKGK